MFLRKIKKKKVPRISFLHKIKPNRYYIQIFPSSSPNLKEKQRNLDPSYINSLVDHTEPISTSLLHHTRRED